MTPQTAHRSVPIPGPAFEPWCEGDEPETLAQRFERQVALHAERPALITARGQVTFDQLNQAANRLAHALLGRYGPEPRRLGLLVSDDILFYSAVLAIFKLRSCFAPFDASLPEPRLALLFDQFDTEVLLCDASTHALARRTARDRDVWQIDTEAMLGYPVSNPGIVARADDPLMVLFTSGSTGHPKATVRCRGDQESATRHVTNTLGISHLDRFLLPSDRTAATGLLFNLTLLNGASFYTHDVRQHGLPSLASFLRDNAITVLLGTPSLFRYFVQSGLAATGFPHLRLLHLSTEPLYRDDVLKFQQHFAANTVLVNAYASLEAGIVSYFFVDHGTRVESPLVPVGYALADVNLDLDDAFAEPGGAHVGELLVSSPMAARGYWRDETASAAVFTARGCRTGDVVRLEADGRITHLGRKDVLTKIRGYTVSPAEVEAALLAAGWQRAAVVPAADEDGDTHLVAFMSGTLDETRWREQLEAVLPAYMIPTAAVRLDIPTTPHGKADLGALSVLAQDLLRQGPHRPEAAPGLLETPASPLEAHLAAIWQELFKVDRVGVNQDFFALGGHSLLAIRMLARLERDGGVRLAPSVVHECPTIRQLARRLSQHPPGEAPVSVVQAGTDPHALPVVFFHGDYSGGGLYCRSLARTMGPAHALYGVHPHGWDGRLPPATFEAMAAARVDAIETLIPSGRLLLGGHCHGGLVAYETARLLRARGRQVAGVFVVNAIPAASPLLLLETAWHLGQRLSPAWSNLRLALHAGPRALVRFAGSCLRTLWHLAQRRPNADESDTVNSVHRAYGGVYRRYRAGRIDVPLWLLRTADLRPTPGDRTAGWKRLSPEVHVMHLVGTHVSCLSTPGLAEAILTVAHESALSYQ